jgi:hypothetical protein
MSTKKERSIIKKFFDKGIDFLSKKERQYIQRIDPEEDWIYEEKRKKEDEKLHDEIFNKSKGGRLSRLWKTGKNR